MSHQNNGPTDNDLPQLAALLRQERPTASALRLDEIKRDVMKGAGRTPRPQHQLVTSLRRRVMAATLAVLLFGISTSNAAASALGWFTGSNSVSKSYASKDKGVSFFFGSVKWGGDSSDDAGKETYCPDDKGSDDNDGSSSDDSDGDKGGYKSAGYGGKSGGSGGYDDNYSDDNDKSSGDQSDNRDECDDDKGSDGKSEKSDDNDKSSDDNSDRDSKSDDNDKSSDDQSD